MSPRIPVLPAQTWFTATEDEIILREVLAGGAKPEWNLVAAQLQGRTGKQVGGGATLLIDTCASGRFHPFSLSPLLSPAGPRALHQPPRPDHQARALPRIRGAWPLPPPFSKRIWGPTLNYTPLPARLALARRTVSSGRSTQPWARAGLRSPSHCRAALRTASRTASTRPRAR